MFDFISDNKALVKKNEELRKQVETLTQELESSKAVIKQINDSVKEGPFAFDFKTVNTFSIERNVNNNQPVTIIGYFLQEAREDGGTKDVVREWYFYCSEEAHKKLVKEFEASRK